MNAALRNIEALSRWHLPPREVEYRSIEEGQRILELMEETVLAQVITFMKPRRCLAMHAASPTARVYAELVRPSYNGAPCTMCLGDRLFRVVFNSVIRVRAGQDLHPGIWWLEKCRLPLRVSGTDTFGFLRDYAPALLPMVRGLTVDTDSDHEIDAADILQLEELRIESGHGAFTNCGVTPSQMTRLRTLTMGNYTAEVADFVVGLPSLTELSICSGDSTAVNMRKPACAPRLLRLSVVDPTEDTLSWIYQCASLTCLSLCVCVSDINSYLVGELRGLCKLHISATIQRPPNRPQGSRRRGNPLVENDSRVESLEGLAGAPALKCITVSHTGVHTLGELHRCPHLKTVEFGDCRGLESLEGLVGAPALECIKVSWSGVRTLGELHRCPNLKTVEFRSCTRLESLEDLVGAPALECITVSHAGIQTLGELHRCPHLKTVEFRSCKRLESLEGLVGAPALECIKASHSGVRTLGELHRCPHLKTVEFISCSIRESLEGLAGERLPESILKRF
ncbi:hypothetical protein NESM_000918500 [Novymonas esmeraldas]|uniref:Uncharacterized protein n=1 Tax=Novymonas esmeraldas TaxID=1808958 RepID=A0AAW0EZS7_9TRYP